MFNSGTSQKNITSTASVTNSKVPIKERAQRVVNSVVKGTKDLGTSVKIIAKDVGTTFKDGAKDIDKCT